MQLLAEFYVIQPFSKTNGNENTRTDKEHYEQYIHTQFMNYSKFCFGFKLTYFIFYSAKQFLNINSDYNMPTKGMKALKIYFVKKIVDNRRAEQEQKLKRIPGRFRQQKRKF